MHVVVEALSRARLPAARLTLFGFTTEPLPYFWQLCRAAHAIEHLRFRAYGAFDPAELPVLLSDVDAVIVAALELETYSIVAHEAIALGVPVIASRIGALPEVIRHDENGLLFEPGSASELATILQSLDADRDRLRKLHAGIRRSDWVSVEERTSSLEAVLEAVVAASGSVPGADSGIRELLTVRDTLLVTPAP
jgi:glycosyltransferase involved in cell wall biosynthesis